MKKYIIAAALVFAAGDCSLKAESLCTDWARFDLCVPITTGIDAAFGYDFKNHRSQGLASTEFGRLKLSATSSILLKAGGITTEQGQGAPFVGIDYAMTGVENPIPGFAEIKPGIYAGHDFHLNEDFYGFKASIPIFSGK